MVEIHDSSKILRKPASDNYFVDCYYYARFNLSFDDRVSTFDVLTVAKEAVCSAENLSFIDSVSLCTLEHFHFFARTVKSGEVVNWGLLTTVIQPYGVGSKALNGYS